ncbi:MAG TPA: hypothetical protein VHT96_17380 [Clostridia bacterium]|nr:hypothetical protein [Clostridia bacterium]
MLAILNRYKLFLIIMTLIVLAVLIILFITSQNNEKIPSRGVFVLLGTLHKA